ncbi:hypothetical protein V6N11_060138 [Hibiscus sabdariffa]|uniref:Uncharacterized protein n=1 Tax=Hibiscus sabdariffa TaxID=183260 RepID=A0ABR2P3K5_9ROSI
MVDEGNGDIGDAMVWDVVVDEIKWKETDGSLRVMRIQGLEALGPTSSNDLFLNPIQHWSKANFKATSKCDMVDNNMAEAFNGWIVEVGAKPIIIMLE